MEPPFLDVACIIVARGDIPARGWTALSQSVTMPEKYVKEAARLNWGKTAAELMTKDFPEMDPKDPHFFLTKGRVSRVEILTETLYTLFSQAIEVR